MQAALWWGKPVAVDLLATEGWESAHPERVDRDRVRAIRLQGELRLSLGDMQLADEHLGIALRRAKEVGFAKEMLAAAVGLAELRRQRGELNEARRQLEDVWAAAERGPYPLHHADACNVLAQVERDAGNKAEAVEAAKRAYRLAWCDGPPFAYHWGLEKARGLLKELGGEEPEMPPFDESKFDPMP